MKNDSMNENRLKTCQKSSRLLLFSAFAIFLADILSGALITASEEAIPLPLGIAPFYIHRILCWLLSIASIVMAIAGLCYNRSLKRPFEEFKQIWRIMIWGVVLLLVSFVPTVYAYNLQKMREENAFLYRLDETKTVGNAILTYAEHHDGNLPPADRWGDLLVKDNKELKNGLDRYAFNKNVSNMNLKKAAGKTVLIFESAHDRLNNRNGGKTLFLENIDTKQNICIFWTDGTAGYYDAKDKTIKTTGDQANTYPLDELRWQP